MCTTAHPKTSTNAKNEKHENQEAIPYNCPNKTKGKKQKKKTKQITTHTDRLIIRTFVWNFL